MAQTPTPAADQSLPIHFTLATKRDDGGKTQNYCVYECTRQTHAVNGKGETVIKPLIMGGNGSIYIGHALAGSHQEWVLLPKAMWEAQRRTMDPMPAPTKKGKK